MKTMKMMTKWMGAVLALCLLLCLAALPAYALTTYTEGDYTYTVEGQAMGGHAIVQSYTGSDTAVTVPATLGGYPVGVIGGYAFQSDTITSITLPETVTGFRNSAFYGCTALTRVNIPEGTKTISGHMFRGCTSLTRVDLPSTITSIGDLAFYQCSALSYIVLPEGVTSIGSSAFYSCAIEELDIPAGVTSIGTEAFPRASPKSRMACSIAPSTSPASPSTTALPPSATAPLPAVRLRPSICPKASPPSVLMLSGPTTSSTSTSPTP